MGLDHNGSGTIALLEIARIFNRLYADYRTQGRLNLMFVLTGGGRFNYAGVKHWLRTMDPRLLESIRFALCLEDLGSSDKLYLHVSKSAKQDEVAKMYQYFTDTAEQLGVPFEIVHTKINLTATVIGFQHEQFSRQRILAGTLSSSPVSTTGLTGSIFDTAQRINSTYLQRAIKFVVESVAKQAYPHASSKDLDVASGSHSVNTYFVESWINFLNRQPRVSAFLDKKSPVLVEIEEMFSQFTADAKKTSFPLEGEYKFFKSTNDAAATKISLYRVKPWSFDFYLSFTIAAYLIALHIVLRGGDVSSIRRILEGKSKRS